MKPNNNFILFYVFLLMIVNLNVLNAKDQGRGHGRDRGRKVPDSCPQLETISRKITWKRVASNPTLPAKLIRMQFHDCFVRGCDGSILLDSTNTSKAEKEAIPNRSLSGFDVIDEIKAEVEDKCPGLVSCADILALAARDAVSYQFRRSLWPVATGRKDGRVSLESDADRDIPSPAANFTVLLQQFQTLGLDVEDLVALSGAHTIGVGHCVIITKRLFNFTGNGDTDPTLDKNYANFLKKQCSNPSPNSTTTVEMDPQSSLNFDTNYFVAINQNKGLFQSDAALLSNTEAAKFSGIFENPEAFFPSFAKSMVKMGSIGVLRGNQGEIRKKCNIVN
ncbi:peroxidase 24-like [Mercurialis annua]|uniref:peroxidase 24-like n=1 Tax=Mercurialis annua TaxID=3986 RepID=UPI0021601C67|nr:peroxidase 24-like [Mercurialis annua]